MDEVYRLFDRLCRTKTALAKLRRLSQRVQRFTQMAQFLTVLLFSNVKKPPLNGAFLAFLSKSIFMHQDDLVKILTRFGAETWLFLILICLALAGSILSMVMCLWSRIYSPKQLDKLLKDAGVEIKYSETYSPKSMYFFQMMS